MGEPSSTDYPPLANHLPFLTRPTTNSSTTAPIVAVRIEPIGLDPNISPNKNQPTSPPRIPTTISPSKPKPFPFMTTPASQPANAPQMRKIMIFMLINF